MNVKITVSPIAKGRYRSRIESSPQGASAGPGFDFSLDQDTVPCGVECSLREAHALMERSSLSRAQEEFLGQWLFGLLFGGEVGKKYAQCSGALEGGQRMRLALALLAPELIAVPWEYLHDGKSFLLKQDHSVVRVIDELSQKLAPFQPIQSLLFVIANPKARPAEYTPFKADEHKAEMEARLRKIRGLKVVFLPSATRERLEAALHENKYDALYFIGHGRYSLSTGGQLILENGKGDRDPLEAADLAAWVRPATALRFVYLNSCSTGETASSSGGTGGAVAGEPAMNIFSGVAQRLMSDGNVTGVVAMQASVPQDDAMAMAEGFFQHLAWGESPEEASVRARLQGATSWALPVVYTYLDGPDKFDENRVACLLNAVPGETTFRILLPSFKTCVPVEDLQEKRVKVKVQLDPENSYFYPGKTFASPDVMAARYVFSLLVRAHLGDKVEIYPCNAEAAQDGDHLIAFGSKSNRVATSLFENFSASFKFYYGNHGDFPGEWVLEDREYKHVYHIKDPSKLGGGAYAELPDYGVIQKVMNADHSRTFFMISGLGDRATQGCAWYFWQHWEELLKAYRNQPFGRVLMFPGGLSHTFGTRIDRRTGEVAAPDFISEED